MASVSDVLSEKHFHCSICRDVFRLFTEPVTMPCGHRFWKLCIARNRDSDVARHCLMCKYWDGDVPHHCPVCKNPCGQRPALCVNTLFSGMVAVYRRPPEGTVPIVSHRDTVSPGEVPCDVCPERTAMKRKAPDPLVNPMYGKKTSPPVVLSSPAAMASPPGLTSSPPGSPQAVVNPEVRTCKNHGEPLDIFCRSDQELICLMCLKTEHKAHNAVLLEEEYKRMHAELSQTRLDANRMIMPRLNRVYLLKKFINATNEDAAKDKESGIKLFGDLAAAAQSHQAMLIEEIEERRRTAEEQAQGFMDQLERDIAVLQRITTELGQSLHSEDHHHLLQTFQSISGIPEVLSLSKVKVRDLQILSNTVTKSIASLKEMLHRKIDVVPRAKLMRARQRYALDVTLDPATATSALVLSEDGKRVRARRVTSWTDNLFVLGKKGFGSSKVYYEVQVKGNTDWKLGVMEESFKRDRMQQVYWSLQLDKNGNYSSHRQIDSIITSTNSLSLSMKPEMIGVLVDFNEREVSFYDVYNRALLHCFTRCKIQEPLYPMLWCNCDSDDAPLLITPVDGS